MVPAHDLEMPRNVIKGFALATDEKLPGAPSQMSWAYP
jgi:hypothetical protein